MDNVNAYLNREKIINKYFKCWLTKNSSELKNFFTQDTEYIESHGPIYSGVKDIESWFNHWNKNGTVLSWNIKQFIHQKNLTVVEWFFKCNFKGSISQFNGVSIIEFLNNKIICLKEFQSNSEHVFPQFD